MSHSITRFIAHNRRYALGVALAGGAIALVFSLVQPLAYRATMRLLIIQATSPTLDAYTAVKSSEKVGRNLGHVIASSSFLDRVLQVNPEIDRAAFPENERARRRAWGRTVESSVAAESSIMEVRVYHERQAQAVAIADGIGSVLVRDAKDYTGSRDITVRVIDSPLISRFPVRPNIALNVLLGFLFGAALALAQRYLFSR
ncbi:MAG: hypothetical protein Q7T01_03815 [bacterium]|nr:hypothetical protein [bacterium]